MKTPNLRLVDMLKRYDRLLKNEPDPLQTRVWAKEKVDSLVKKALEGMK